MRLHYGDPFREQKLLVAGEASCEGFPRFEIAGPERLSWLHAITAQDFARLQPHVPVSAYILNYQGHIIHALWGEDDGQVFHAQTEPGHEADLLAWLGSMVFATKVEMRSAPVEPAAEKPPAGSWAYDALRIAAGTPRIFRDTDDRTLPNELAMPDGDRLGASVHLKKGCYPGQETVARVYNIGRPPRRLTRLLLDGSEDRLPDMGADVLLEGEIVGRMGTSAIHYELGPIGLALLKRDVPTGAALTVDGIAASQQVIVDPDVGLHFQAAQAVGGKRWLL
ncbi:MAG: folate-binding protein [Propionibacteriaceae bacterium]|nr:folate-binding protein [Propionibacteriaceae bacterium]